jgi:hypothetical protein
MRRLTGQLTDKLTSMNIEFYFSNWNSSIHVRRDYDSLLKTVRNNASRQAHLGHFTF